MFIQTLDHQDFTSLGKLLRGASQGSTIAVSSASWKVQQWCNKNIDILFTVSTDLHIASSDSYKHIQTVFPTTIATQMWQMPSLRPPTSTNNSYVSAPGKLSKRSDCFGGTCFSTGVAIKLQLNLLHFIVDFVVTLSCLFAVKGSGIG